MSPSSAPILVSRTLRGLIPKAQAGRIAPDGSPVDLELGDYGVSTKWQRPDCDYVGQCWAPETARMVPRDSLRCPRHGWPQVPAEDPYPLVGEERAHAERAAWATLAEKYGIPPVMRRAFPASILSTLAMQAAREIDEDEGLVYAGKAVVLYGRPGCGKSWALTWLLAKRVIEVYERASRDVVVFHEWRNFVRLLIDPVIRAATIEACLDADALILDDVGHSYPAPFALAVFEDVAVHREARNYPLLFSTNLHPTKRVSGRPSFAEMFGDRVVDRLRGEWGHWFDVDAPSLRVKKGGAS